MAGNYDRTQSPDTPKEVMAKENPFITTIAEGDRRTSRRTYQKGNKTSRFNDQRMVIETVIVNADCIVDVIEKWDRVAQSWCTHKILWETARVIPPKPPGFWAKLWARITQRNVKLPTAKLLNG